MAINKIMVLGAGTMGMGIAQVFAEAGKTVIVRDIADAFIQRGEGVLKKNLEKKVAKGKITEDQKNEMLSHVSYTLELADAKDCDLVVEAAIEVLDVKKDIFKELDTICKPETILASNTSSISITAIAAATKRPEKVLGMHFFNPAPAMKLVEVIRGARTNDETFQAVYACAKEIGKNPVEVGEAPGFVVNRILFPMINEAIIVLENGIASKEDIDTAMMYGANQVSSRSDHEEDGPRWPAGPEDRRGLLQVQLIPLPSQRVRNEPLSAAAPRGGVFYTLKARGPAPGRRYPTGGRGFYPPRGAAPRCPPARRGPCFLYKKAGGKNRRGFPLHPLG